jgi:hypothetical protein
LQYCYGAMRALLADPARSAAMAISPGSLTGATPVFSWIHRNVLRAVTPVLAATFVLQPMVPGPEPAVARPAETNWAGLAARLTIDTRSGAASMTLPLELRSLATIRGPERAAPVWRAASKPASRPAIFQANGRVRTALTIRIMSAYPAANRASPPVIAASGRFQTGGSASVSQRVAQPALRKGPPVPLHVRRDVLQPQAHL